MSQTPAEAYRETVDDIEQAYEFMLAYAAQGRQGEGTGGDAPPIRAHLEALSAGLGAFGARAREAVTAAGAAADDAALAAFFAILDEDAARARAKVDLVLTAASIGSQLVDNLNASIHLRALLTDLFLIDEYVKSRLRAS